MPEPDSIHSSPDVLADVLGRVSDGIVALDRQWRYTYANDVAARLFGLRVSDLIGREVWELFPDAGPQLRDSFERALATQQPVFAEAHAEPIDRWLENRIYPSPDGVTVYFHDISERKRTEGLLNGQMKVLESISSNEPLDASLTLLVRTIEAQAKDLVCTILLVDPDGVHIRHCAAPTMPAAFCRAVDGVAIGPSVGSCGTAAFRREPVVVTDIATDPLWADWRALILPFGFRACWSTPIMNGDGDVLGTFAVYYREVREPKPEHLQFVATGTHVAAIAITHARQQAKLRETGERLAVAARAGHVGFFDYDVATRRTYYSPEWKRQLGFGERELADAVTTWEERLHPDDLESARARIQQYLAEAPAEYEVDYRLRHRDGQYRWMLARATVVRNEAGRAVRVLGAQVDITERKTHEREIERLNRLYAALSHVNQRLIRIRTRNELFAGVARVIVEHGGFLMAWIGCPDAGRERIVPIAQFGGDGYVERLDVPLRNPPPTGHGPTATAFLENRTYIANDFFADPSTEPWREPARARGVRSIAAFPIRRDGHPIAVLIVYAGEPDFFQDREVALLDEAAADVAFGLEHLDEEERRQAAEAAVRESEARLRALAQRIETVREQERTAIAREIHDVLAQELTKLKIDLVWLFKRLPTTGEGAEALVARVIEARQQTDAAISTVQRIATELRPVILDSLGLSAAIEWQADEFARRTGVSCHTVVPPGELVLDRDRATAIFRILQESLTNVARHAHASTVDIALERTGAAVTLSVSDDGVGIGFAQMADPRSIGLIGMRERAQAFGGTFAIGPRPGGGTSVSVSLPLAP